MNVQEFIGWLRSQGCALWLSEDGIQLFVPSDSDLSAQGIVDVLEPLSAYVHVILATERTQVCSECGHELSPDADPINTSKCAECATDALTFRRLCREVVRQRGAAGLSGGLN